MLSPRNIRFALALLVVTAIIGIVAAILRSCSSSAPPEPVAQQTPSNVDLALRNARFTEVRNGATVWTILADRAEYSKEGEIAHLSGIRMVFLKNRTAGDVTVTADTGTYFTKSRNVNLRGNVHVTTDSGIVLDTETLDYRASTSHFVTDDRVTFRQQRMTLDAQGMDLDMNGELARFHRAVNAVVKRR